MNGRKSEMSGKKNRIEKKSDEGYSDGFKMKAGV